MKPILFNTEMVRAILEGRKTFTRRVVKIPEGRTLVAPVDKDSAELGVMCMRGVAGGIVKAPYKVNDILYVRETWSELSYGYEYKADGKMIDHLGNSIKYRPSIHMPKEAARIFLRVTDVRVERLQDIDVSQAIKEGVINICENCYPLSTDCECCLADDDMIDEFSMLWDSTIKKDQLNTYGWDANPYVWVIEFERITQEQAERESGSRT